MAHKVESMAWHGEMPWHGLGVEVSNDLTVKQMQKAAGADWQVEKVPLYIKWNDAELVTGDQELVRVNADGTIKDLDRVSSDWNPTQNDEAFEFFHEWVEEGNMKMHTAGVLDEGKYVWVLAKVKDGFSLFNGKDNIDSYLLFTNPHRYGQSITVMSTPIRVVCNNTLQLALKGGKEDMTIRVDHRTPFDAEAVKEALNMNTQRLSDYKKAAEFLSKKKAKKEATLEYFRQMWPVVSDKNKEEHISRTAQNAMKMIEAGTDKELGQPGAQFGPGTWWQNYNAVTFTHDHKLQEKNLNNKVRSIFYGFARRQKVKALNLALEMAKAA